MGATHRGNCPLIFLIWVDNLKVHIEHVKQLSLQIVKFKTLWLSSQLRYQFELPNKFVN